MSEKLSRRCRAPLVQYDKWSCFVVRSVPARPLRGRVAHMPCVPHRQVHAKRWAHGVFPVAASVGLGLV